jgi:methionyl-tRNA formyltransferase
VRLVYLGTPEAAVPPLQALEAAGHDVVLVVSQPDRKRGRGGALLPSPVKAAAIELGLKVTDQLDDVLDAGAELGVVVAFGRLIKPVHLAAMPYVNIHFSLLPRWRGAAPVERALLAGDPTTGCCLMALEAGLDTGPVYRRVETEIGAGETASQLRGRLVQIGTQMLVEALTDGFNSLGSSLPQVGEPLHAAKLTAQEFQIDWSQSAATVHGLVRLESAWTTFRGKRLKVLNGQPTASAPGSQSPGRLDGANVQCGDGTFELLVVQPEGKASMSAAAWLNGVRPTAGESLGDFSGDSSGDRTPALNTNFDSNFDSNFDAAPSASTEVTS